MLAALLIGGVLWQWVTARAEHPWLWVTGAALPAVVGIAAVLWLFQRLRAGRRREFLARNADLSYIDGLTGRAFEHYVAELLRRDGCRRVTVVGGAGDGGIDITGAAPGGRPFVVQCKLHSTPVRPGAVREFQGVLHVTHRGRVGVFVASHGYTSAARAAADGILLVDREGLALWAAGRWRPDLAGSEPAA
ncbi:restriction system protein [Spinactinospora alkalitolerans]|uniref:Restriction system protein n=1 Tax=Spinactinospora alkalitolerans TaxID=687207 RepID=A0A852U4U2_9ACTN|nr:DUF2034 domain-containing protein [Spinactinospora alkalitolerans]NYE50555.1 restriction system protein [Spinactinospora alkalitolerans]